MFITSRYLKNTKNYIFCVLHFLDFLREVVQSNWESIIKYSAQRIANGGRYDTSFEQAPPVDEFTSTKIVLSLVLSTDGVFIVDSSDQEVWPVWFAVCQLPPKIRMSQRNIVLAALHRGNGKLNKPNWEKIVPHIEAELQSSIQIESLTGQIFDVSFKVIFIVTDLMAKWHVLNMYQHNGYYGCNYCTIVGKTIGRSHCYYPIAQGFTLRTPEVNENYVALAESLKRSGKFFNVCGVKGRSAFASLVDGLPLTAGVDYMHCLLQGVYRHLLEHQVRNLTKSQKHHLDEIIENLHAPRETICHSRKIRGVSEIHFLKANEIFNYLIYVGPVIFKDRSDATLYDNSMKLILAVRLLLESNCEPDVVEAEGLLNEFCEEIVDIFQNEKIETINVHLLRHLVYQTRRFGPLFIFSAMSFESANRLMRSTATGTHSFCSLICRRYVQRQRLLTEVIESDTLEELAKQLTDQERFSNEKKNSKELLWTPILLKAQDRHQDAVFLSRTTFNGVFFDSASYKRCPSGPNSFVKFLSGGREQFGQVQFFMVDDMVGETFAHLVLYLEVECPELPRRFYHKVQRTDKEDMIGVAHIQKMFHMKIENEEYMLELVSCFDHN